MKNAFLLLFPLGSLAFISLAAAQEPVLLVGGAAPAATVQPAAPAVATVPAVMPVAAVPVVYVPVVAVPVAYGTYPAYAPPIVSGGYCPPPNVIYFGGPNSCYNNGYFRPGCSYSPSVIYFGRGEACQRGYAFSYPR